jgi:hypothetical protein
MFQGIIELLFHPDVFFSRKQHEEIRLVIPAIIVGIGGIVSFITPLTERAFSNGGDLSNFNMMPSAAIFFLVLPFISWLLVAGILYVFSRLFSGTGSFPATLQNCGYGYLPNTLFSLIVIINSFAVAWSMGNSFMLLTKFLLVLGIISFFSIFWSGWLWTVAMEKTHTLSLGKAMVGPELVVLLYLSTVILNIFAHFIANGFPTL